jgi:hypothetical protein
VPLTVTCKVARGIVLGVVAVPDSSPDVAAQHRLYVAGDAFVTLVHAIDAYAQDIELGTKGVRSWTSEKQHGKP